MPIAKKKKTIQQLTNQIKNSEDILQRAKNSRQQIQANKEEILQLQTQLSQLQENTNIERIVLENSMILCHEKH